MSWKVTNGRLTPDGTRTNPESGLLEAYRGGQTRARLMEDVYPDTLQVEDNTLPSQHQLYVEFDMIELGLAAEKGESITVTGTVGTHIGDYQFVRFVAALTVEEEEDNTEHKSIRIDCIERPWFWMEVTRTIS